jgi:serine/threonine protein phosphatase PrpC
MFVLQIQEETLDLHAGDRFLICSDGLYKQVSENELVQQIQEKGHDPAEMLKNLVDLAVKAEHSDNVTVVYIEIEP